VVEKAYVDELEGGFEPLRNAFVGLAGLGYAGWMIVGEDDRSGINRQRFFDDFTRVNAGAINRAAEHLVATQHPVSIVQVDAAKQLMPEIADSGVQVGLRIGRAPDRLTGRQRRLVVASGDLRQRAYNGRPCAADAWLGHERICVGVQQLAKPAKARQQAICKGTSCRLTIAAVNERREQFGIAHDQSLSLRACHDTELCRYAVGQQGVNPAVMAGFGGISGELQAKLLFMNVLLGITGGIAAYKTPDLVRRLRGRGADVQIIMTSSAEEFVTATALQAVSGRPIRTNLWDKEAEAAMSHIELARWADVVLIAPATAEIMARLASGAAADLLTTLCLATEAPLAIAPAMNRVMWENPAVQANRETLEGRGVRILGPGHGLQACGETGVGRMLDPDEITAIVFGPQLAAMSGEGLLAGKTVLVTAGPTREPIDPVRYITNRSSGKMGYAMASAAAAQGARVVLISGPVSLTEPRGMDVIHVKTAEEMYAATHDNIADVDVFVAAAAVSDYRPADSARQKIKKSKATMSLDLVRSQDILDSVASLDEAPFTVGFAAETENVRDYALGKLRNKNLDMIIANRVGDDCGFDRDDNTVNVFWRDGEQEFATAAKIDLAHQIVRLVAERFAATRGADTQPRLTVVAAKE